mgnify:CR=1 FL=1
MERVLSALSPFYEPSSPGLCAVESGQKRDMFHTQWIPQGGIVVNPGAGLTAKASVSMGYRNPSFRELYLYRMADAAKGVINQMKGNMLYINVANNLPIDCDCNGNPAAPRMADLGILASTDPVALDRACVDMVFNSSDPGKKALIHRINEMHGPHILDAAEALGIGRQKYKIVTIE